MNIIITGASRGIGFELVKTLSRHRDNRIVALSRNGAALNKLVTECARLNPAAKVIPYEFDLNQFEFYPLIAQRLETMIHRCDILVNNAGCLINKPFSKLEPGEFDEIYNVNVKSPFFLIQALLPIFNKGAHIVNISSMGGISGTKKFPGLSAYSSSKGAVTILTEILAEELASYEIKVNCLAMGAVQTEMFAHAFPGLKAHMTPTEMAPFVADFAINGSRYFNGKVIPVSASVP
jgi:3-oxoacyl-[acyl-carrier protein] reductase